MMHNNTKPKEMPSYRSTSSSFMNTFQNNKFFQQNSLGSDKEDDSLSSSHQMLDDALEESFNDILEAETDSAPASQLVFSADDFMPQTSTLAPPREKPPPLPAVPPPPLPDQQKSSQMENEIDKQEREIIESLEREEKEHKKYLASNPSGLESSSVVVARGSRSQSDLQRAATSTATTGTQHSSGQEQVRGWRKSESAASVAAKGAAEAPRKRSEGKDYNKHWLIQEAEQRRISEAKQKQNQQQQRPRVPGLRRQAGPQQHLRQHLRQRGRDHAELQQESQQPQLLARAPGRPPGRSPGAPAAGGRRHHHRPGPRAQRQREEEVLALQGGVRPRSRDDHRKFAAVLPHPLLQMLRLQHPAWQRRDGHGCAGEKQPAALSKLLLQ